MGKTEGRGHRETVMKSVVLALIKYWAGGKQGSQTSASQAEGCAEGSLLLPGRAGQEAQAEREESLLSFLPHRG